MSFIVTLKFLPSLKAGKVLFFRIWNLNNSNVLEQTNCASTQGFCFPGECLHFLQILKPAAVLSASDLDSDALESL